MKILHYTSLLVLAGTAMVFAENTYTKTSEIIGTINRAKYYKSPEMAWKAVRMAQAANDTPRSVGELSSRTSMSMRALVLTPLLSPNQDIAHNEALLDAFNIDRSNYNRSSPDTYIISMLTDKNLIAREIALMSLAKQQISEPIKNTLLEKAAEDDWLDIAYIPNPAPITGDGAAYFIAPFRDQSIRVLNINGIDIRLNRDKLTYDGLAWLGETYLAAKSNDWRSSKWSTLMRLNPTHPAIIYAKQQVEKVTGANARTGAIDFNSPELREVFKFLAEATPEMWKEVLEEMSLEAVATLPAETAEPSIVQMTPEAEPTLQPTASPSETVESPSLPLAIPIVAIFIIVSCAGGYWLLRKRRR